MAEPVNNRFKNDNDLISVIVPVYNVALYLEKCVNSIIAQTYNNLEILLVDDGSTDGSGDICNRFAEQDSRIVVLHQKNKGLSAARNVGLSASSGSLVSFVDSDDYLEATMLETLHSALSDNNAEMSMCSFKYVNLLKDKEYDKQSPIIDEILDGKTVLLEKFFGRNQIYWCVVFNKLYKRYLFDNISFPEGYYIEDLFVMPKLIGLCNRIACIRTQLYNYVQREGSILHSNNLRDLDHAVGYLKVAEYLSSDKDYSVLLDDILMKGLGKYKTALWYRDALKISPDFSGKRKKEIESLFRVVWKKIRKIIPVSAKKKAYYDFHAFSFALVKRLHFLLNRD